MNIGSKKQHNSKFNKGDLVQVMNIKNHPLKNKTLQLVECTGVDKHGCHIWVVVYDDKSKTYTFKVSTSCFNLLKNRTSENTDVSAVLKNKKLKGEV